MHAACRIKTRQTNEFAQFQLVWNPTLSHARRSGRGSSAAAALAHRRLTGTAADLTRVRSRGGCHAARYRDGRFAAGERLPTEPELAASFGVSRSVIREAVSRLKAVGVGSAVRGPACLSATPLLQRSFRIRGAEVGSGIALREILELRLCLEVEEPGLRQRTSERVIEEFVPAWSLAPIVRALQTLRGVDLIVAVTFATQIGDVRRFESPRQLMGYVGLDPGEWSTGETVRRGGITRAGNLRPATCHPPTAWRTSIRPCRRNWPGAHRPRPRKAIWRAT